VRLGARKELRGSLLKEGKYVGGEGKISKDLYSLRGEREGE